MSNSGTKYEKPVWICNTFSKHGKKACSSQQIPDEILRTITTEVLGLVEFDEIVFEEKIKEIQVSGPYKLIYIFDNEKNVQKEWHHKSRSETWREKLCVRQEQ
jgi:Flp pilus assembly CpaF family ATPase